VPEDDPTELFDLCDEVGRPLGATKPRADVHRDGDWHRSLHVWVVLEGAGVLLQRRSLRKDTHPDKVDVAVAGHLRAGESVEDALRESEEEIGLPLAMRDLVRLGVRRHVGRPREGLLDREIQEVFLARSAVPLEGLRPDPAEVSGLLTVPVTDLRALVGGEAPQVNARGMTLTGGVHEGVLRPTDLLPHSDGYFVKALGSIAERLVSGERVPEWVLGW
jgi:isopentenyldiphosphate isomerase